MLVLAEHDCQIVGMLSHDKDLSDLEIAIVDLVPVSLSIAFSVRELIRHALVPAARILLRPLLERAATVDYLVSEPSALDLWQSGWKHGARPSFASLLARMTGSDNEQFRQILDVVDDFNSVVHADPAGCRKFAFQHPQFGQRYSLGMTLGADEMVSNISAASAMAVTFLASNAKRAFRSRILKHGKEDELFDFNDGM